MRYRILSQPSRKNLRTSTSATQQQRHNQRQNVDKGDLGKGGDSCCEGIWYHRLFQFSGAKSSAPLCAKAATFKKKNENKTRTLHNNNPQTRLYIVILTVCFLSARSFMVPLREEMIQT